MLEVEPTGRQRRRQEFMSVGGSKTNVPHILVTMTQALNLNDRPLLQNILIGFVKISFYTGYC